MSKITYKLYILSIDHLTYKINNDVMKDTPTQLSFIDSKKRHTYMTPYKFISRISFNCLSDNHYIVGSKGIIPKTEKFIAKRKSVANFRETSYPKIRSNSQQRGRLMDCITRTKMNIHHFS